MQLNQITVSQFDRVTAAEVLDDGSAVLFVRDGEKITEQIIPFRPFVILTTPELLNGLDGEFKIQAFNGNAPFAYLASFPDTTAYDNALKFLKSFTGYNPSAPSAPYMVISDQYQQLFVAERFRLFRGLELNSIRRMQFDIETVTTEGYEFPNPQRADDKIVIITMCDNTGWEKVISLDSMTEKELLQEFVDTVTERDPDVLEGHNIFRFDLPYIETRAKRNKVKLNLGRRGLPIKKRNSRFNAAERTINYTRYDVFGRHIIDTYHLTIFYDISHRNLDSYGLKYVAKHFGVAAENRTYIEGEKISESWENDRENLLAYALDDVRETRAISDILSPSYFYQSQLIPLKYQDCVVRGNATRVNALLTAEYINRSQSIPYQEPPTNFTGALTRAFKSGVFKNIWHCDVRSLYPSIILAEKMCPSRDTLGVFPELLDKLRTFRLEAKDAEKSASDRKQKDFFNALQTTFKILINSFYGYLGFAQGNFNDYATAEQVTARGREILTMMLDFLNNSGATVLEMDTDGIYFQPPAEETDPDAMEKKIQAILPPGIEVELDSTYPAMFSYKSKNYALLNDNGEITVTGAALKSRGIEPFQRDYIHQLLTLLLTGRETDIENLTEEYRSAIDTRKMPLEKLAKTEVLSDSIDSYKRKQASGQGRRSAAYELAAASNRDYQRGDQVSYYITGTKKKVSVVDNSCLLSEAPEARDENSVYYLGKLEELHQKFSDFIPDDSGKQMTFDLI